MPAPEQAGRLKESEAWPQCRAVLPHDQLYAALVACVYTNLPNAVGRDDIATRRGIGAILQ